MNTFFKGVVICPECAQDTSVSVKAQKESTGSSGKTEPKFIHIPVEDAVCEHCGEAFPIFFYEDGIELCVEDK